MDDLRQCRDGHRCENGSLCQENINQEGSYYCDCESAVGGLYAGLSCEFKAEEECRFEGGVEAVWFCVNKGTCVVSESKDKLTMRCDCTDEFEGPHCEYIMGARPNNWPSGKDNPSIFPLNNGMHGGVVAAIVLTVLIFIALIGFAAFYLKKHKDLIKEEGIIGQNAPRDQSEALAIDADGSGLREAIKSMTTGSTRSTGQFNFSSDDPEIEIDDESNGGGQQVLL